MTNAAVAGSIVIESRLNEIDDAITPIIAAFQLASALDPGQYLRAEHAERLEREIAGPLRESIADAIARLGRLESQLDGKDIESIAWNDVLEATLDGVAPSIGQMLSDELWQHVTDVCFTARSELRRAERTIRHAEVTHEDRLAACEAAHRKLRRALAAVLSALGRARGRTFPELAEMSAEAETAAAVRRMYAKFRRSLPPCDPSQPSTVRRALRYSAVSLAVMVGSSDFGDARIQDRALILKLQRRILRWAHDGASDADGALLYMDIVTTADLLRSINQRQELAAHDQHKMREAIAALAGDDPADAIASAVPALRAMAGRDDALDELVAFALRDPPTRELVAALRTAVDPPTDPAWSGAGEGAPE
jgi:hypothetical protein